MLNGVGTLLADSGRVFLLALFFLQYGSYCPLLMSRIGKKESQQRSWNKMKDGERCV
jgi:hypothetical protein